MTQITRLISGTALALILGVTAVAASGQSVVPMRHQSVTGDYLAGREALADLRTADAARYFHEAAIDAWDNPIIVERSFIAYAADGQIDASADTAQHLIEISGSNDLAALVLGAKAVKERRYAAAAKDLDHVGGDTFAGITGGILRAWALVGQNQIDAAHKVLDGIGQGDLDDFLVFHRALMADVSGNQKEALEYAQKAYEADPFVARIVEAYARILGNAGRFDEAEKVVADYEKQGLSHPLIDAVKEALDKKQRPGIFAADVQSGAAEMFHSIGAALAREGNADVAAVFLQLGMYLDPDSDVIDLLYGQILDSAGQHVLADNVYDGVSASSPMKPMAVVRVAQNLDAMGKRDDALLQLGQIVRTNPGDVEALSVLGDLQRAAEKYGDAASTYSELLTKVGGEAPGDWRYYYVRGIAYERNKEWPKAEADFQKALKLNPDQPQVLNYLGYSWVDQGINLMPALDMIKKAVAASPNDGYIVDSLGWAYYRLGRLEEAVTELEQAVQLRPTDPEINDHLGDAYWRVGRQVEARFQWNIAASVDEDGGQVKARVAAKLEHGLDALGDNADAGKIPQSQQAPVQQ